MNNKYLLILKNKNVFNSNIQKLILFKTFDEAYEYGLNIDSKLTKEIIYNKEDVLKNNILWISLKDTYPKYSCKLIPVSQDFVLNSYLTTQIFNEKHLVQYLFKNLKQSKNI
jgi:hypothetical protein